MEPQPGGARQKIIASIVSLIIIGVLVTLILAFKVSDMAVSTAAIVADRPTAPSAGRAAPPSADEPAVPNQATVAAGTYRDGTYAASGSYSSPGGTERIVVKLTLQGDTIADATVSPTPATQESSEYQGRFVSGFKPLVVGKRIDAVRLSRVSGSSLTSRGFNAALADIKAQARI